MTTKLFVGGLPWKTTDEELRAHFEQIGTVETASVVTERETGRSRGFGFIEMASEEDANKAIDAYHDQDFQGRRLTVNIARPKGE